MFDNILCVAMHNYVDHIMGKHVCSFISPLVHKMVSEIPGNSNASIHQAYRCYCW